MIACSGGQEGEGPLEREERGFKAAGVRWLLADATSVKTAGAEM